MIFFSSAPPSTPSFYIYVVAEVGTTAGLRLRLISSLSSDVTPAIPEFILPASEKIPLLKLSPESILLFQDASDDPASGFTCRWPQSVSAVSSQTLLDLPAPALSRAPILDLTSSGTGGGARTPSLQALLESAVDTGAGGSSKSRHPQGHGLTEAAAGILSEHGHTVLTTGNITTYHNLYYLGDAVCQDSTTADYWHITAWRVQVQPFELLMLVQSIMSVDIRAFADLLHKHTRPSADAICDALILHEDKLGHYKPDMSIIGGYLDRLHACLRNYSATLDVLFRLRSVLRDGLKAMMERVMSLASSFQMGPLDRGTPILYHYLANRFQHAFAQGYGLVRSGHVRDERALLIVLERFPDTGSLSTLTMELMGIRVSNRTPDCLAPLITKSPKPTDGFDTAVVLKTP